MNLKKLGCAHIALLMVLHIMSNQSLMIVSSLCTGAMKIRKIDLDYSDDTQIARGIYNTN